MRLKSALAVISVAMITVAMALGLASQAPAEAGCYRAIAVPLGCGGPPGPQGITHFVYYPQYYDVYYTRDAAARSLSGDLHAARVLAALPAPLRCLWTPLLGSAPLGGPVVAVPAPTPVPVGCCLK